MIIACSMQSSMEVVGVRGLGSQSVETAWAEAGARSACTQARRAVWSDLEGPHALRTASPWCHRRWPTTEAATEEALGVYAVVTPGLIWLSRSSKVRAGSFC